MNKFETPASSFSFKVEDLFHLYNQTVVQMKAYGLALCQGTVGVYRVSGAVITASYPNYSITAGHVFYNDELFEVDAWAGVAAGAQVPVWELHEVDGAHEPHNLYVGSTLTGTQVITKIRKLRPRLDASGTGLADLSATKNLPLVRLNDLYGLQSGMTVAYTKDFDAVAAFFDGTGLGSGIFEGFAICNGNNGTIDMRGFFPVGYNQADTDYNEVGKTGGAKEVTLTALQSGLRAHNHTYAQFVPGPEVVNSGGGAEVSDYVTPASADNTSTTSALPAQDAHENRPPYKAVVWLMKL